MEDFAWCLSSTGNLQAWSTLDGFHHQEHIALKPAVEGYAICVDHVARYHDRGGGAAARGFAAPVVLSGPTRTGITLRRTTSDGAYRLDQRWTGDVKERDLTVQMTLVNLGTVPSPKLKLLRIVDVDAAGQAANDYDRTRHATWIRKHEQGTAVVVSALSLRKVFPTTAITSLATANAATPPCAPTSLPVPGVNRDVAAFVIYDIGVLNPGRSRTVKVGYLRQ